MTRAASKPPAPRKPRPAALESKVAWVVGGSGSLGQAIVKTLRDAGARVVVSSRRTSTRWQDADVSTVKMDLTSGSSVEQAARAILRRCKRIDVLVNCTAAPIFGDFLELSDDDWNTVLQSKLLGYVRTMRAVIPSMVAQGGGNIVNVSGRGGRQPTAAHLPGGCANAGVTLLTKGLADLYAGKNIRINTVSPGPIDTPRHHDIAHSNEKLKAAAKRYPPLGRLGEPADVADAVLFLISARAAFITGVNLPVDGGGTATV